MKLVEYLIIREVLTFVSWKLKIWETLTNFNKILNDNFIYSC